MHRYIQFGRNCDVLAVPIMLEGLKESKQARIRMLKDDLFKMMATASSLLSSRGIAITPRLLSEACVDFSIGAQTQFKFVGETNARAALVGDAVLSMRLAFMGYVHNRSPAECQQERTSLTKGASLALVYDIIFGKERCVLTWDWVESPGSLLGIRQKAEFLEALIGVAYACYDEGTAYSLCDMYLKIGKEERARIEAAVRQVRADSFSP
jgi:hypothetical protein